MPLAKARVAAKVDEDKCNRVRNPMSDNRDREVSIAHQEQDSEQESTAALLQPAGYGLFGVAPPELDAGEDQTKRPRCPAFTEDLREPFHQEPAKADLFTEGGQRPVQTENHLETNEASHLTRTR